ncbi:MAG TPA: LamG-like jellyroll fold domain-containing protein [Verrucomicrobiae bacterium]|nr:LamG-like jellyroll fold domain-containing protein [Verrucomicrobiae bacterium]
MKTNKSNNNSLLLNRAVSTGFRLLGLIVMGAISSAPAQAQSLYSNTVMSLNPVAYWPLQETVQPPRADVETNYGSLGPAGNAYYGSTNAVHGFTPGAIAGDSDPAVNFLGNSQSFAIVPTTDNRVSLPPGQPFTVECWTRPTGSQSYVSMVCQTGPNNAGGLNAVNNSAGWSLNQNFAPYLGTGAGNNPACWSFHVFNGVGFTGGAEVEISTNVPLNQWTYLVAEFDGTNCTLYANCDSNGISLQLPINNGPNGANGQPGNAFVPDTWDPIQFGCTRGLGANPFHGCVDEVAIYTNMLTFAQITNHFYAATNGLAEYSETILADSPSMYWRMDAPKYTNPPASSFPQAANYGLAGANMTNFNTQGNSAVYQPGTIPGVAGPPFAGFGTLTNACAFNGIVGAVDAGYNALLDPTGISTNFTVVAWFRANPMDNNGRYNALASHSDSSWKIQLKNGTTYGYKGASTQPSIAPTTFNVNDGNWHMVTLEASYTNGVGTNVSIALDDNAAVATAVNIAAIPGKLTLDAFIGGAPDYLEPTNGTYNTGQQYFAGRVAHVAYFTNALTTSQIQTLFYAGEAAPLFIAQPSSAAVDLNGAYSNSVTIGGTGPFYYQWYENNAPLANQTNASLVLNPVLQSDGSPNYYVIVSNLYGSVTSAVSSLTVVSNLTFIGEFPIAYTNVLTLYGGTNIEGTNYLGSSPTFSISALGALPISYQWVSNNSVIVGATNSSLTVTNCQMTSGTNFYCVLSNSYGLATSMVWAVSYSQAPIAPFPQATLALQPIAYWRLNEPDDQAYDGNPGAICHDYQSGNDAIYTNVYLSNFVSGTGYSPTTDPDEHAAQFGSYTPSGSFAGYVGTNVDFSAPSGSNAEFTVSVWANGDSIAQAGNAGLVTKGYFNGEEFTLDEGSSAVGQGLRFFVRTANSNSYAANGTFKLANDSNWHFVVGICDETNGTLSLYVDGILIASGPIPAQSGIINSASVPLMIGARSTTNTAPGNNQFKGLLNEAAVFNYAMTSNQISAIYGVTGVGPFFINEPISNTNLDQGATLVVATIASGSDPLWLQWYDVNTGAPIAGQTNSTLIISNIAGSDNYFLAASNIFGTMDSSYIYVNVVSGVPQIYTDVNNPFYALPGGVASNSVTAFGTLPLVYQWQFSNALGWVNLSDNSRITGSKSNILTIANVQAGDVGNYQVIVSNSYGPTTSSVATLNIPGVLPLTFTGNSAAAWTANGNARFANGQVTLTDPAVGGNGSFFFQVPQYIGAFMASFTYQVGGNMQADGTTFCLQTVGPTATGSAGGQLGYGGIEPSAALELNIFSGNGVGGVGYSFNENGAIGPTVPPGSIVLNSGDPINVTVDYMGGELDLTFMDTTTSNYFSTNFVVPDLTQVLGSTTAYVGFTGSYGGDTSVQTVSDFQFVSIPPEGIHLKNGSALISWPGAVLGYSLQETSDLTSTNWAFVTNESVVTNGLNQVTLPVNGSNSFYRLILQESP